MNKPNKEEILQALLEIFDKPKSNQMGWPRSYEQYVTILDYYPDRYDITICNVNKCNFADLEKVAEVVGSKKIDITPQSYLTPCSGTDLNLTVYYE